MIALIGNLHLLELLTIAGGALLVFGKRLPEVAVRGAGQLVRLRRSVMRMWREAGLEEELRRVRREIEQETSSLPSATDLDREADWRAEVQSDIESLDLPTSPSDSSGATGPREDHPEDFDDREPPMDDPDPYDDGEVRDDIHATPDPDSPIEGGLPEDFDQASPDSKEPT
ncbi:MAG TPA: twin-arginine translocase TatA/TatE family subunit [Planctomycetes bacterium]|nr:twin-arginine translocase TatA/TatE family subunit [Planctomycetota bacterium]HIK60361.1 twin-arginine translocase TatA/TatE family subunit [Planctomycetota bacterium]